ncbi:MAG: L,D-transpeptidase family protein [Firmicutes bacterium]|nr:L,D-transpeptidase family protein [Bacillota bacterium]
MKRLHQKLIVGAFPVILGVGLLGAVATSPWPCRCTPEPPLRLKKPFLRGPDVKGLQEYLAGLGFSPGPCDGIYGPQTAAAVQEFQRRHGLRPDGIVHPSTWAALGQTGHRTPSVVGRLKHPRLVIDIHLRLLILLEGRRVVATFPVAVGKEGTPTPVGNYRISYIAQWGGGFGTRFLGLDVPWGIYGIHGTNKPWTIGGYESHGCIRMFNEDVERLAAMVEVGTSVHIIGDPFYGTTALGPGEQGAPVVFLQRRLRQLGFYHGRADGYYGSATEKAVMAAQKAHGLPVTGRVGWAEMAAWRLRQEY